VHEDAAAVADLVRERQLERDGHFWTALLRCPRCAARWAASSTEAFDDVWTFWVPVDDSDAAALEAAPTEEALAALVSSRRHVVRGPTFPARWEDAPGHAGVFGLPAW
jgi:hypothetical protein